jgi:hypothetical protein
MANVNFVKKNVPQKNLTFEDLLLNDNFKILGGRGAVYRKVRHKGTEDYFMLEEATGKLFHTTSSPVEKVSVDVVVNSEKPNLYDKKPSIYGGF